jgi:glycosyltransferase involved in cell wall biosynthesis
VMHVLHVLDYSPPFRGGFHEMLRALGEGMRAHRQRVTFGFPFRREWFADFAPAADAIAIREIRRPIRSGFAPALDRVCRARRVDLVHLHFSFALPLALVLSPGRLRLPVVYHWHNPPKALMPRDGDGRGLGAPRRALARGAAYAIARFADDRVITRHLAVSREIRGLLLAHGWTRREKIGALPNAIVPAADRAGSADPIGGDLIVGCVANFRPQKDHPTLIRAFRRVVDDFPACRLILAGDGPCRSAVEEQVAGLGLEDRVEFAGFADDPSLLYRRFDLFVLASHFEGQSMVVLEAMNHGLPIVATRVGGTPETVSDGVEGLLVPPADAPALAEAMLQLLRDPDRRRAMGAAGQRRVRREFSIEAWVEALLEVYGAILAEHLRLAR